KNASRRSAFRTYRRAARRGVARCGSEGRRMTVVGEGAVAPASGSARLVCRGASSSTPACGFLRPGRGSSGRTGPGGPPFAFGLSLAARYGALEIFANRAGIAVSIGTMSGEELGDDGLQRRRTRRTERFGRLERSDPELQPACIRRAKRLDAGQHL